MVSIIMPVHNAALFLYDCLDSILSQSLLDWELLAVDDQSTDESLQILNDYATKDKRIRVLKNPDKGISPALKLGFRRSYGEFITRMDADDIMPPTKLDELVGICVTNDHCLATGKVEYFSESEVGDGYRRYTAWLNGMIENNDHWQHIYKECVIPSPCWMMRREDFQKVGAFEAMDYPEDYDLAFRAYAQQIQVIGSTSVLHLWRDHSTRASRNDPNYADNRFLEMKLSYFLKLECPKHEPIALWGAGDKGKFLAKGLLAAGKEFTWITDNPLKIGVDIYGVIPVSSQEFNKLTQDTRLIIAIASPKDQEFISKQTSGRNNTFWFC